MGRNSEGPWFRESKNTWYATIGGKGVSLRVRGENNRSKAQVAWFRLMASDTPASVIPPPPKSEPPPKTEVTVETVARDFLAAKRNRIKNKTLYVYGCLMKHVTKAFGPRRAASLKAEEVSDWLFTLPVGVNTRCDVGGIVTSAFKWAERVGLVSGQPMKELKRPARVSRGGRATLSKNAHTKLLEVAHPALKLLLTLLHETGARPSELSRLEAQHVDFPNRVAVLTEHKTANTTGKPRLIVFSPKSVKLLKAQAALHPTGPLLRNGKGKPWKKDAIVLAMKRVSEKAGVKVTAYNYRHDFATTALAKGVPDATVAALLGHSGTAMLHKHYSYLTSQAQVMREALKRVR